MSRQQTQTTFANAMSVLIADSDQNTVRLLLGLLARKGICGSVATAPKQAIQFLDKNDCDLVFCGVDAESPKPAFELFRDIRLNTPEMPVVMMADAVGTQTSILELAVRAIQAGCCDFVAKPLDTDKVETLLDKILPNHPVAAADESGAFQMVGKSAKLAQTIELAKKVAPTSVPVLVSGQSGTGKELVASLIHHHSRRVDGPYMQVNCAALNDALLESELFGHEKGAFTGAVSQRKGRFERAHGGTLLLDEVTETPVAFQAKLLRVLEQQDFERVGGNDTVRVDVRIISTTNKDMAEEIAEGRFRQDLYYRLCGVRLEVPPLAQRSDDLVELVWHFVNLYARQAQRQITKLSPEMMEMFAQYNWPGNIRQLRNVVRTALILGSGPVLSLADASWLFDELQPRAQRNGLALAGDRSVESGLCGLPLVEVERQAILETLEQTDGNQAKAARILGISDRTLRGKVRQYRQQGSLQPV